MDENKVENIITDEQAEALAKDIDEFAAGLDTDFNTVVEQAKLEDIDEEDEIKTVNTTINPETGETQILSSNEVEVKSFEDQVNDVIDDFDFDFNSSAPATFDEIKSAVEEDGSLLKELSKDSELSDDEVLKILDITNRRLNKEEFNVYKEFPDSVKKMVDVYISSGAFDGADKRSLNTIRNSVSNMIIDQFKADIQIERAKHDFAHELANIYKEGTKDIAETSLGMMEDRNQAYRESAEKIEDPEKKDKMLAILDRIDDARDLSELKEFAKKCKIKRIELEKPEQRVFTGFLNKYKDSSNNIYDIKLCATILYRHLQEEYTSDMIVGFFIVFCKMVANWDIEDPICHSYIYYVLYYCAMLDGDKSDKFKNNVKEVLDIIVSRNSTLFGV